MGLLRLERAARLAWWVMALSGSFHCATPSIGFAKQIGTSDARIEHRGGGVFLVSAYGSSEEKPLVIDLKGIAHGYDPEVDPDVPLYMDVTLDDEVPPLLDEAGNPYAILTLYQIDPPLADIPSKEPGIDRGIDMRSPADMVKSAYSNYVSTVVTDDEERLSVPGHPIGHFFVKLQIPGYPTILTGMTTIQRADEELVELTLGQRLGLGGVLLTPQPGRLNSAREVLDELALRQRRLLVIDGLHYRSDNGKPSGPTYVVEDGNVAFARFLLPIKNAEDALASFVQYVASGQHRTFGALQSRPYRGTGAGCAAFAMSWLKASNVIPFIAEPPTDLRVYELGAHADWRELWRTIYRRLDFPWSFVGCDERTGANRPIEADYTVYDSLLHGEGWLDITNAVPGLAEKIRADQGAVVSTLFAFGALTPVRDLVLASKRKDPNDDGTYEWANETTDALTVWYWDNKEFSNWVKRLWASKSQPQGVKLVKEGRFKGVQINAMNLPRQTSQSYEGLIRPKSTSQRITGSCRQVFDSRM